MSCEIKNKIKRKRNVWMDQTEGIFIEMQKGKIDDLRGKRKEFPNLQRNLIFRFS